MKKVLLVAAIVLSATAASAGTILMPAGGKYVPVQTTGGPSGAPHQS